MSERISKEEIIEEFKGNKVLKFSTYAVGVIVLIVLGFLGYKKFIAGPKQESSKVEIADAIMYLEKDSTQMAQDEFEYLASEYEGYKGGEISKYAIGNIYFQQGDYEAALNALKDVNINDTYLMTLALGTQGDCYSELGDYPKAVEMYIKAAQRTDNEVTSPMYFLKAGLNAEEAGDYEKAAEYYKVIKDKYVSFSSQKGIEKYITRAENMKID